ncbi:prepilin-type N-terminal cleavage/methylation domain-containing protein [Pseudobacteriovorax antillogorgiicola]|uniref:Prepilin-type N-terminal cleavage/methylation domain-containing protein n=1 Tax=Pseudobacteriovorax antillogorgiicola TaxID=1513793 RepID=A0A1Y6B6W1_9BACT|nr:prepilin-type N-terminal cleavage/methylation domain-containing protein [Pseudobacteriovorax antillogorgiicola]SME95485.1 prepilin-type N-terminal cleavage/methylation domain-containing protein [Pseudobacteriovorax antillogorgiicola]
MIRVRVNPSSRRLAPLFSLPLDLNGISCSLCQTQSEKGLKEDSLRQQPLDRRTLRGSAGFSLIEVILVIAVVGSVFVMVLPNLGVIGTTEAAGKLSTLSGDIRSAFDLAVLNRKPYRMVFEFNSGDYYLETTDRTDFKIMPESLERELTEDDLRQREEEFNELYEEYKELAGKEVEDEEGETMIPPTSPVLKAFDQLKPPKWTRVNDIEWIGRSLGPYYAIQDMQTEHHARLIRLQEYEDQAVAYLYFFPHGYVERAVIHIGAKLDDYEIDPEEIPYTVTTRPYEGLADVQSGYIEVNIFEDRERR